MKIKKSTHKNKIDTTILEKKQHKKREKKENLIDNAKLIKNKNTNLTHLENSKITKDQDLEDNKFNNFQKIENLDTNISFKNIDKKLNAENLKQIIDDITYLSLCKEEVKLDIKIRNIKKEKKEENIILLLKTIINSFQTEMHSNKKYQDLVYLIIGGDVKNKNFPLDILQNIINTKCFEIISFFVTENNSPKNKKNNIEISF